jgi:WD40 repeat protein
MNNHSPFKSKNIGQLGDYITCITYNNQGNQWAASSAHGEVVISMNNDDYTYLLKGDGITIDILSFSPDDHYLAAAGQGGKIYIWQRENNNYQLIQELNQSPAWISHLQWHPKDNLLALAVGKNLVVWQAETQNITATLPFNNFTISTITWSPDGEYLGGGGYQEVKVWSSNNWQKPPRIIPIETASTAIAWSPDGKYLASANLDNSVSVIEWTGHPDPWLMQGLTGKIRQLQWVKPVYQTEPLLAVTSRENLIIWYRSLDDDTGWEGAMIGSHLGIIQGVRFHPDDRLLVSIGEDGAVCFWENSEELLQTLNVNEFDGLVAIANHPNSQFILVGSSNGQLIIIFNKF